MKLRSHKSSKTNCNHYCELRKDKCCHCSIRGTTIVHYTVNNSNIDNYSLVVEDNYYCPTCKNSSQLSNDIVLNSTEKKLAEALAMIKLKDIEIADLKDKLDKTDNVIKGYFS
jgi:hypothetical protein